MRSGAPQNSGPGASIMRRDFFRPSRLRRKNAINAKYRKLERFRFSRTPKALAAGARGNSARLTAKSRGLKSFVPPCRSG